MTVTPLGKFLRKIRIDHDERLYDMAKKVGVSSAFLSSVENGHKKASDALVDNIITIYKLDEKQKQELYYVRNDSIKNIDISSFSPEKQQATLMFARKFDELTDDQIRQITDILKGKNNDD